MTVEEIKAEIAKLTRAELIEFETALKLAIESKRDPSTEPEQQRTFPDPLSPNYPNQ